MVRLGICSRLLCSPHTMRYPEMLTRDRYSDEKEKHSCRAVLRGEEASQERMYFCPPGQEDPSPMYEGLHTNLPNVSPYCWAVRGASTDDVQELMAYRDFPFPEGTPLFPDRRELFPLPCTLRPVRMSDVRGHGLVLSVYMGSGQILMSLLLGMVQKYLEDYADRFDLRRHIRFNTRVERLYQSEDDDGGSWTIESRGLAEESREERFDHVCVANGHYSDGWIPDVQGLSYVHPQDPLQTSNLKVTDDQELRRSNTSFTVLPSSGRLCRPNGPCGRFFRFGIGHSKTNRISQYRSVRFRRASYYPPVGLWYRK